MNENVTSKDRLDGKVVLITGASSGVGRAAALAFGAAGAKVVLNARRSSRLENLCKEIDATGGAAAFHAGDAGEESNAIAGVQLAIERFGKLDILVNNAGQGNYKQVVDTSAAEYDQLMNANVRSGFLFSRHAVPIMIAQRSGTILFISSIAGLQGYANEAVYSATKFAQVGLSQALDAELHRYNIKVGVLCPGGIATEFAIGKGRTNEDVRGGRMMDPADVADAILYACRLPANVRIPQLTLRHMS